MLAHFVSRQPLSEDTGRVCAVVTPVPEGPWRHRRHRLGSGASMANGEEAQVAGGRCRYHDRETARTLR